MKLDLKESHIRSSLLDEFLPLELSIEEIILHICPVKSFYIFENIV